MIVIVRLSGGLGNQLFQYAAGRALVHARGARLLLDVSSYDNDHLGRQYRLDRFRTRARLAPTAEVPRIARQGDHDLPSRVWWWVERCLPRHWRSVFTDRKQGYDPRLLRIRRSVVLKGYWQSESYFQAITPLLRRELVLRHPPKGRNATLAQEILDIEAASVHVRRGDYLTNSSHVVLPISYYEAALARLSRVAPKAHYFVFSDNIPWCREHLDLSGPTTFVDHNGPEDDYEDLRLMSLCKHHIIANSSFSWWAAWLCENPQKNVIAPKKWFNDPDRHTHDLVPSRWHRI